MDSAEAFTAIATMHCRNGGICAYIDAEHAMDPVYAKAIGVDDSLKVKEVVLVAQDLAAYGRDQGVGEKSIIPLIERITQRVDWVRLLYLYPSELNQELIDAMCALTVPFGRSFYLP